MIAGFHLLIIKLIQIFRKKVVFELFYLIFFIYIIFYLQKKIFNEFSRLFKWSSKDNDI